MQKLAKTIGKSVSANGLYRHNDFRYVNIFYHMLWICHKSIFVVLELNLLLLRRNKQKIK